MRPNLDKRRSLWALLLSLLPICVAAAVALGGWRLLHQPYAAFPEPELDLEIPLGLDADDVLRLLESEGLIPSAGLARLYLIYFLEDPSLKAGEYRFRGAHTTPQVLAKLTQGAVRTHRVTVVEGLTLEETARALAEAGFGDQERLVAVMGNSGPISDLDPEATDLEGYLFPDTYSFARGTSAEEVVATLVATFRDRLQGMPYGAGAADLGGSAQGLRDQGGPDLRDLVTLASIVEKEARLPEERPLIAGVYANRLRRGMALYADPTIIFALKKRGTWDGNLRRPDLELDSPYNTYIYPGLPPGPICSPGAASLAAAAAPAETPHLYFVSRNDGSHVFARTLAEHNRNVNRWQKRYWRERWARERGARASAAPE